MLKKHVKLLTCPDCKDNLHVIEDNDMIFGFSCLKCDIIYPIKNDIPILLAKQARNYELEYPLIKDIEKRFILKNIFLEMNIKIKNTL